ncbi:excinuclease ABC subunit UvrB [Patescibacteria group bacterium]|nr:excinuclease ABC subunit UvrB [Patescibacteria group bacterium]
MPDFKLVSKFKPAGDQPEAIKALMDGFKKGVRHQTLLGITGSGKTFVASCLIERLQKPTLVISHNKTLAAQLCSEFREFFPENAVQYFVSYYDYYQPEAYMPQTDTYIEKDASINEEIDKFRHAATTNLLTRNDVIIVASVSCIYGIGPVEVYEDCAVELKIGDAIKRDDFLRQLADIQYTRSQMEFKQGMFHVLGDTVEVFPPDRDSVYRIEFFGDDVDRITECDSFTGEELKELSKIKIFPSKHSVTSQERIEHAIEGIRKDLDERYKQLKKMGKNLEAERIKTRTEYDIEIMLETGYCQGIENYTRYLNDLKPGQPTATLLDYFPKDFLMIIDESHITVPQVGGMHNGNLSRKNTLVEHGFRLPSAHDNRPLKFGEFEKYMKNVVYTSATPGKYELEKSKGQIVEQIIRPTGLVDPEIIVHPARGQMEDIMKEIRDTVKRKERVLITTLTKRSAEDLTDFLKDAGVRVSYLHSDIDTLERIEILRDLRLGKFDVLVGINLLREGLDLPEVSFIGILDADKQGFLRSTSALIQTIGRCARNVNGHVKMYADKMTDAMKGAIGETRRRREKQVAYNKKHGITPKTIKKAIADIASSRKKTDTKRYDRSKIPKDELKRLIRQLEEQMDMAAQNFEFEKAAELRDQIERLKN